MLRQEALGSWEALREHPFVVEMAAGTLPLQKFRFYIDQNLLYLPEYARAIAYGISRSRNEAELEWFTAAVRNIVEVEIPENRAMQAMVSSMGEHPHPHASTMAPATQAYSSFLLSTAQQGQALEILALILPCAWSYGDIARHLKVGAANHPIYTEWLSFFATDEYQSVVNRLCEDLDTSAQGEPEARMRRVSSIFKTGVRLEWEFWNMSYTLAHWPDLEVR